MKITTNNYELIYSGTIIQIENSPINIVLPDKSEGDYTIIFDFLTLPNEKTVNQNVGVGQVSS